MACCMPMLPKIPKPIAWGALLMPLLWTAVNFVALGIVNPLVRASIEWPWFILSQFVFGVVAATGVHDVSRDRNAIAAGLIGGIVGGVSMAVPALLWSLATGHGIWYPINLLSAIAIPHAGEPSLIELQQFHSDWFIAAVVAHAVLSLVFGLAFAIVLPGLPAIPAPLAWGAPRHAAALDSLELRPDGCRESRASTARRLAVVRRLTICLRPRGGDRRRSLRGNRRSAGRARARSINRDSPHARRIKSGNDSRTNLANKPIRNSLLRSRYALRVNDRRLRPSREAEPRRSTCDARPNRELQAALPSQLLRLSRCGRKPRSRAAAQRRNISRDHPRRRAAAT